MPYCHECGTEVGGDAAVCPECGASLSTGGGADAAVSDASTGPRQNPETGTGRRGATGDSGSLQGRFLLNSLIGGATGFAVGSLLGTVFLPVYFLGIVAGSVVGGVLQDDGTGSGAAVGAVSGVLATVPFVLLAVVVAIVGVGWLTAQGVPAESGPDTVAGLGAIALVVSVVAAVVNALLGLVGGLVGGALAEN
jgi:hypothetical protein